MILLALTQETQPLPGFVDPSTLPGFVDPSTLPGFVPLPTNPDFPPSTLRELLLSLLNKEVQILTPFDTPLTGILIAVELDYVVLRESDGTEVLINFSTIEAAGEI